MSNYTPDPGQSNAVFHLRFVAACEPKRRDAEPLLAALESGQPVIFHSSRYEGPLPKSARTFLHRAVVAVASRDAHADTPLFFRGEAALTYVSLIDHCVRNDADENLTYPPVRPAEPKMFYGRPLRAITVDRPESREQDGLGGEEV